MQVRKISDALRQHKWCELASGFAVRPRGELATSTAERYHRAMDSDKIDEAVLALLYLGMHERDPTMPGARAWKTHDWDALDRLPCNKWRQPSNWRVFLRRRRRAVVGQAKGFHASRMISNPATKAKSVVLTEEGLRQSEAAFRRLFDPED